MAGAKALTFLRWTFALFLFIGATGGGAQETVPIDIAVERADTKFNFSAALGRGPQMRWKESRSFADAWPHQRSFAFDWGAGSWVAEWLRVRLGSSGIDALWSGRLRAVGCARPEGQMVLDVFWEYPLSKGKEERGVLHARFMRLEEKGLIYCRLHIPSPPARPVHVILTCHPGVYWADKNVENLVFTPRDHYINYGFWEGKKYRSQILDERLDPAEWSAMVLGRRTGRIDLIPMPAAAILVFPPHEVAALRVAGNAHEHRVEVELKQDKEVFHFSFGGFDRGSPAKTAKRLQKETSAILDALAAEWWQTTRPRDVIDMTSMSRRMNRLFAACALVGAENDLDLEDSELSQEDREEGDLPSTLEKSSSLEANTAQAKKILENWTRLCEKNQPLTDPRALCGLYEEMETLRQIELRLQAAFLQRIEKMWR